VRKRTREGEHFFTQQAERLVDRRVKGVGESMHPLLMKLLQKGAFRAVEQIFRDGKRNKRRCEPSVRIFSAGAPRSDRRRALDKRRTAGVNTAGKRKRREVRMSRISGRDSGMAKRSAFYEGKSRGRERGRGETGLAEENSSAWKLLLLRNPAKAFFGSDTEQMNLREKDGQEATEGNRIGSQNFGFAESTDKRNDKRQLRGEPKERGGQVGFSKRDRKERTGLP